MPKTLYTSDEYAACMERSLTQVERDYVDKLTREFAPYKFHGAEHTKARRFMIRKLMSMGIQSVHTPYALCNEMIGKLSEYTDIKDKKIAVLFNMEFVEVLIYDFGVNPDNIFFLADDPTELISAAGLYGLMEGVNLFLLDAMASKDDGKLITSTGECEMKFDVVVGNPPYAPPDQKTVGRSIWQRFVPLSVDIAKQNGFVCLVHPAKWRQPGDELHDLLFKHNSLRCLSIQNKQTGQRIFGAITRFDWYVLRKQPGGEVTKIRFENNDKWIDIDLSILDFLPNFAYSIWVKAINLAKMFGNMQVIRDRSFNPATKPHLTMESDKFCFPIIHSINSTGIRAVWSSEPHPIQLKKKVIFSNGEFIYPVYDEGRYGVCDHALYTLVDNQDDGTLITRFLKSKILKILVASTKWSNFETNKHIFSAIPDIRKMSLPSVPSDSDFYNIFQLTTDEIRAIETRFAKKTGNMLDNNV